MNALFFSSKSSVNLNKKFSKKTRWLALFMAAALGVGASSPVWAAAELLVSPTRLLFTGAVRGQELILSNKGNETGNYRISFVNKHVKEDGSYTDATEPGPNEQFADTMLRASVRELTLQPGQVKIIRILARKPDNLPDGEYRTHILFDAIDAGPASVAGQEIKKPQNDTRGATLSFGVKALYSISIPAIVRQGSLDAGATLEVSPMTYDPKTKTARLGVTLNRTGNRSIYGDLTILAPNSKGKEEEVYVQRGLAVHSSVSLRRMTITLTKDQHDKIAEGKARLVFAETQEPSKPVKVEAALN